jgi:FkbM family methyltransferase
LFYAIYSRIPNKKGVVRLTTVDGNKIYVNIIDDCIVPIMVVHGVWEEGTTKLIRKIVKPGSVVADVGAHVGYFSSLFASLGAKVVSFEPDSYNFSLLKANVPNGTLVPKAVTERDGTELLYLQPTDYGRHSLRVKTASSVTVPSISLDSYFKGAKVDLIKTDTEGNELEVLMGATQLLEQPDIEIIVEYAEEILKDPGALLQKLRSHGFKIYTIGDDGSTALFDETSPAGHSPNLYCSKK